MPYLYFFYINQQEFAEVISICNQDLPCTFGGGDCDEDWDCENTLICGNNNCASGVLNMDCCTTNCTNDLDCMNQECNIDLKQCRLDSYSTNWSRCNHELPCDAGEGDCDFHSDCKGSLICGNDNCAIGIPTMDCCTQSPGM